MLAFRIDCCPPGQLSHLLQLQKHVAFFNRQSFKIKLDGFFDISHCFFQRAALRLTALQFGAPRIKAMLIFFDDDRRLASHGFSVKLIQGELRLNSELLSSFESK